MEHMEMNGVEIEAPQGVTAGRQLDADYAEKFVPLFEKAAKGCGFFRHSSRQSVQFVCLLILFGNFRDGLRRGLRFGLFFGLLKRIFGFTLEPDGGLLDARRRQIAHDEIQRRYARLAPALCRSLRMDSAIWRLLTEYVPD